MRSLHPIAPVICAAALTLGCAPAIGDSCQTAINCSINGDRACDLAQPNGACTVFSCESETCPDEAVCVRWRPEPSRLTFTACMRRCDDDGGCRGDEGYRCKAAEEILSTAEGGDVVAEVIDEGSSERFCVATMQLDPEE